MRRLQGGFGANDLEVSATDASGEAVSSIAAGHDHSLALTTAGSIYAWGLNADGQLGDGTTTNSPLPEKITLSAKVSSIASGEHHSLALASSGSVFAWGSNGFGQLGDGTTANKLSPTDITSGFALPSDEEVSSLDAGYYHSLALTSAGKVFTWGLNADGQLGDGTTISEPSPTDITSKFSLAAGEKVSSIVTGEFHSLALTSAKRVFAWGHNAYGQLGDGTTANKLSPTDITSGFALPSGETIASIAVGSYHSFALTSAGRIFDWGYNGNGQLGDGTTGNRTSPADITSIFSLTEGETVSSIYAGYYHSFALTSAGNVYAWGINSSGQLGDGTSINSPLPKKITVGGVAVSSLAVGNDHSLALAPAGIVYAWGLNASGQLGDGTTDNRLSPTAACISPDYVFAANLFGYRTCDQYNEAYAALSGDYTALTEGQKANLSSISSNDYPALTASGGSYDYGSSSKTIPTTAATKWAAILALHASVSGAVVSASSGGDSGGAFELSATLGVLALGSAAAYGKRRKRGV